MADESPGVAGWTDRQDPTGQIRRNAAAPSEGIVQLLTAIGLDPKPLVEWIEASRALHHQLGSYERWSPLWPLGWAYGGFSPVDLYDKAVAELNRGEPTSAENLLEDGWNEGDRLETKLIMLARIAVPTETRREVGARREVLLRLALEDHRAGRFHASIPVVIAQTEGIVRDVFKASPFQAGGQLTDNVTAIGHPEAAALFQAGRRSRRLTHMDDDPPFPSRHGVVHGRSLGYDTRRNSTKALIVLFAVVEICGRRLRDMSRDEIADLDRVVFDT